MNLIVIGKDTDSIAISIWNKNTNFTILNKIKNLKNNGLLDYIDSHKVVLSVPTKTIIKTKVNYFIEFCLTHKCVPIFIAENKDDFVNTMYVAVNEQLKGTLLYTKNDENKDFEELLNIAKEYMSLKGFNFNDNAVRTPRKRKTSATKK